MGTPTLIEFMDSLGPKAAFTAQPHLCADSDTLTMYFENTPSLAERIDSELTVFKSFNSGELVGFQLKGILPKMNELGRLIHVTATTPKVHVKLLLMIYMAEITEHLESYKGIANKVGSYANAQITVPVS